MSDALTRQLARLLQLPKNCVSATLTLRYDSLPLLRTECFVLELGDVVVSSFELRPLEPLPASGIKPPEQDHQPQP